MIRKVGVLALTTVVASCAARSPHDQTFVSDAIESRTGHALRPDEADDPAALPPGVVLTDGIEEDEAVAVALWNNPDLAVALAELGLSRADLLEAGLIQNPVFSLMFPWGPKQLELLLAWPIDVLWRRPHRIAAAQADVERVAEQLVESGLDLVRSVRVACAELRLARERVGVAGESEEVRRALAAIAEARLRVGDLSPLEATAARVDAARAADEATRARRDVERARARLAALLGPGIDATSLELDTADETRHLEEVPGIQALLDEAFAARPELRATELAMEAAAGRAGLADSELLRLTAYLDANGQGREGFEMGPGLLVEIPLLGSSAGGRAARARAELDRECRRYLATLGRIETEVRLARTSLLEARESLEGWDTGILPLLAGRVTRVEKALAVGEVSTLDALEARRSLLDALGQRAEVSAAVSRAEADLERGVGRRLGPAAPATTPAEAR